MIKYVIARGMVVSNNLNTRTHILHKRYTKPDLDIPIDYDPDILYECLLNIQAIQYEDVISKYKLEPDRLYDCLIAI